MLLLGCGGAGYELGGEVHLVFEGGFLTVEDLVEEDVHGDAAHFFHWLCDSRDAGLNELKGLDVVEGDEGDVVGDVEAQFIDAVQGCHGEVVVQYKDALDWVGAFEQFGEVLAYTFPDIVVGNLTDELGVEGDTILFQGFAVAAGTLGDGCKMRGGNCKLPDTADACLDEVLDCSDSPLIVVGSDKGGLDGRDEAVHEDGGELLVDEFLNVAIVFEGSGDDESIDLAVAEHLDEVAFLLSFFIRTAKKDIKVALACGIFHGTTHLGVEVIGDVGDDESDGVGSAHAKASGHHVGLVIQLIGFCPDPFLGIFIDTILGAFPIQDHRDEGLGYSKGFGNVGE